MESAEMLQRVRKALGRGAPLDAAPVPPVLEEPIIRLVHSDIGLGELFARSARGAALDVQPISIEDLNAGVVAILREHECRRIAIATTPFLERLNLHRALKIAGLDVRRWDEITLDAAYDLDCGITDVYAAVAETGSLVIRPAPDHGRALSLVPPLHIAIVEPRNIVPDLFDLFEKMTRDGVANNTTLITGPSKTSDIEGVLVVGVHGPGRVQVFLLK